MKVIALYNIKGGVGKTATCVNLAYLSAAEGNKTLLWDLDSQGASTFYYQMKAKLKGGIEKLLEKNSDLSDFAKPTAYKNLDLIPADESNRQIDLILDDLKKADKRFKKLLGSLENHYDYVFVDCPPMLTLLSDNIFHVADLVLVPTIPTTLSARTHTQIKEYFGVNNFDKKKIYTFFSMVSIRKKLHAEVINSFLLADERMFKTQIPQAAIIEQMGVKKSPLPFYAPKNKATESYRELWAETKESVISQQLSVIKKKNQ